VIDVTTHTDVVSERLIVVRGESINDLARVDARSVRLGPTFEAVVGRRKG
jgi:hypothetical protein